MNSKFKNLFRILITILSVFHVLFVVVVYDIFKEHIKLTIRYATTDLTSIKHLPKLIVLPYGILSLAFIIFVYIAITKRDDK